MYLNFIFNCNFCFEIPRLPYNALRFNRYGLTAKYFDLDVQRLFGDFIRMIHILILSIYVIKTLKYTSK